MSSNVTLSSSSSVVSFSSDCSVSTDDDKAVRSCSLTLEDIDGPIKTIHSNDSLLSLVKKTWIEQKVAQCGYCQPGQIMAATSLLKENRNPTIQEIKDYMAGNICRCGTYPRILKAIEKVIKLRNLK